MGVKFLTNKMIQVFDESVLKAGECYNITVLVKRKRNRQVLFDFNAIITAVEKDTVYFVTKYFNDLDPECGVQYLITINSCNLPGCSCSISINKLINSDFDIEITEIKSI